jgi:Family of unknown function (DUF6221)
MSELSSWLLVQIAADERVAEHAIDQTTDLGHRMNWAAFADGDTPGAGAHQELWSPDRALAECEAKRRIVELHPVVGDGVCDTCVVGKWGYPAHGDSTPERWPCGTLRALALTYTDRPGYEPEWRP